MSEAPPEAWEDPDRLVDAPTLRKLFEEARVLERHLRGELSVTVIQEMPSGTT